MAQECKEEDGFAPGNDCGTPDTCEAYGTFWVVQETVDAAVVQLWSMVEEKVTEEPAEFS